LEGEAGEVGAAAAAGFVPGPAQVAADGSDGDERFPGDLGVGMAAADQGDQLFFPCAGPRQPGRLESLAGD
jgi:hypothetical protein